MKLLVKIISFCLWLGVLIWFSSFGSPLFSKVADFIKVKLFGTDISPPIDFAITFIPWNCFISLLVWLPILFFKQWRFQAAQTIAAGAIFFIILVGVNVFSLVMWCVFFPETIDHLDRGPDFSALEQSALADGWTSLQLKAVWWTYILVTTAFGAAAPLFVSQIKKEGIFKTLFS